LLNFFILNVTLILQNLWLVQCKMENAASLKAFACKKALWHSGRPFRTPGHMMPHKTLRLFAPAKINLFLHITGKQADGYHTLQSMMGFVDVGDDLTFSKHDSLYIDVKGPFAGELEDPKDNLVYKAARHLAEQYKVPLCGKIVLTKNLPVAAGLGGGSADAAATLKGLVKLWDLPEEPHRLQKIALGLGADVPACLYKKLVWAEGVGEKMTPLPEMPGIHFVLANPLIPTPTAEVFKKFRSRFSTPLQFSVRRKSSAAWIADLKIYHNDLTDAACAVTPAIRDVLDSLSGTTGCQLSRLAGSGATCFGIYGSAEAAKTAANDLRARHPSWWVTPADMLK
jgi:4-diphosphocytidyl-2-C-methyl-D-erythritol kinase